MDAISYVGDIFGLWAHDVYLWTGFGTIVGLVAWALTPGRDRAGVFTTVLVGIAGAVIGSALVAYFWEGYRVTPQSPVGFGVAVAGAFLLLFFHRLIGGYAFPGDPLPDAPHSVRPAGQAAEAE